MRLDHPYSSNSSTRQNVLWLLLLSFIVATCLHIIYMHVAGPILDKWPSWHQTHLSGLAPAPLQYRWLSYMAPEWFSKLGFEVVSSYLIVRFFALWSAMFFVGMITVEMVKDRLAPSLTCLAVGLFLGASCQAHFQPSEEPNLAIFGIFIWLLLRDFSLWTMLPFFVVGILNKDTVGFLIPFIVLFRWLVQDRWKTALLEGTILSAIFIGGYLGIRAHFGTNRDYLGGFWQVKENIRFFRDQPLFGMMWMLASVFPLVWFAWRWKEVPKMVKVFVPTAILFIIGHLLISRIEEFRTYVPLTLVLWPGVLLLREARGQAGAEVLGIATLVQNKSGHNRG